MPDVSGAALKEFKKDKVPFLALIDGRHIDPNGDGELDSAFLVESIQTLYPVHPQFDIGILDWEGQAFQDLQLCSTTDSCFQSAKGQFFRLLRIAKATRPKIKWGIYFLPFTYYWNRDSLLDRNKQIESLLAACDVLMPSLYDFYPDGTRFTDNEAYYKQNLRSVLAIGHRLKKPVYVFVWHRWHDSNPDKGLELIPIPEFKQHMRWITNAKYRSTKVKGLIWFSSDMYFYQVKPSLVPAKTATVQGFHDQTLLRYYQALRSVIRVVPLP
jgi:hypothetical protein